MKDATWVIISAAVGISIFVLGIWCGASISTAHADREREVAIKNAVSFALETSATPLNCKDNEIIQAVRALAENGAHVKGFSLWLDISNTGETIER